MSAQDHTVDGLLSQITHYQKQCDVKNVEIAMLRGAYAMLRREVEFRDDRIRKALALPCFDGVRGTER
jgi:hypothetical protein